MGCSPHRGAVVIAVFVIGCHAAHVPSAVAAPDASDDRRDAGADGGSRGEADAAAIDDARVADAASDRPVVDVPDGPLPSIPDAAAAHELVFGRCVSADGTDCLTDAPGRPFVTLDDGASVPIVAGAQGAMMFVFGLRVFGIDPGSPDDVTGMSNPVTHVAVTDAAGTLVAELQQRVGFRPSEDALAASERVALFLVLQADPSALPGTTLTASATVQDRHGIERRGELRFLAAPPP